MTLAILGQSVFRAIRSGVQARALRHDPAGKIRQLLYDLGVCPGHIPQFARVGVHIEEHIGPIVHQVVAPGAGGQRRALALFPTTLSPGALAKSPGASKGAGEEVIAAGLLRQARCHRPAQAPEDRG